MFDRNMTYTFRKAELSDIMPIWDILQSAIQRRKNDGSEQWQDGYPNKEIITTDIERGEGFVLLDDEMVIGYTAIIANNEPAYDDIKSEWLTSGDYVVVHRVALSENYLGKGLAKKFSVLLKRLL
ncbi:GNAT family N-acetyltransferase [Mucilaginibacter antarcticus]|uniref:GNAT family N-acetyltransferase n=1 Tax=Mucilaginibacter antarcticus TaxID=1855725 RepID=UPI003643CD72